MRKIFLSVLCIYALAISVSYLLHRTRIVTIPLTSVEVITPRGCDARKWGNAIEFDCKDGGWIVYYQKLAKESPRAFTDPVAYKHSEGKAKQ